MMMFDDGKTLRRARVWKGRRRGDIYMMGGSSRNVQKSISRVRGACTCGCGLLVSSHLWEALGGNSGTLRNGRWL